MRIALDYNIVQNDEGRTPDIRHILVDNKLLITEI